MKIILTLFVLMAVALSSAHYICGPNVTCQPNYSCIKYGEKYVCNTNCGVTLEQHVVKEWTDDNSKQHFIQVEVSITNHGPRPVDMVIIGAADGTLVLRDMTSGSMWNIQCTGGDFTLPSHSSTLACGQTFNFGYINRGYAKANLYIKNVHVL